MMKFSSTYVGKKVVDDQINNVRLSGKLKCTKRTDEIYEYINSKDSLKNKLSVIPSKLISKRKSPESIYLIDSEVAGNYYKQC